MSAWLEVSVTLSPDGAELVHGLFDLLGSVGAAERWGERTVKIIGYFVATEEATEKLASLMERLEEAYRDGWVKEKPRIESRILESEGWEASLRESLPPLKIGRRFLVTLTDEPVQDPEGRIVLRLQSLGGFGTGHHPTTRWCIELMEGFPIEGKRVLDVGTGSGILAIAAIKLGAKGVIAVDIDDAALEAARENAIRNGCIEKIRFVKSDLIRGVDGTFDFILSNLTAELIKDLAWQLRHRKALVESGVWVGSGISVERWDKVRQLLTKLGYHIMAEQGSGGWIAFAATLKAKGRRG